MGILDLNESERKTLYAALGLFDKLFKEKNDNHFRSFVDESEDGTKYLWSVTITKSKVEN